MQRQRADRLCQQQSLALRWQRAQIVKPISRVCNTWRALNTLGGQSIASYLSNRMRMRRQAVWVGAPVHFNLAREVRDRVRFHPHCGNAQLLAFHEHGARPAEWIKDPLLRSDVEPV